MQLELRERNGRKISIASLFVALTLSVIASTTLFLFSALFFPLTVALMASVMLLDFTRRRVYSLLLPVLVICSSLASYFIFGDFLNTVSVFGAFLCALVIAFFVKGGYSKSLCVGACTVITICCCFLLLWLVGYHFAGAVEFKDTFNFYNDLYLKHRQSLIDFAGANKYTDLYGNTQTLLTYDSLDALYEALLNTLIGVLGVISFLLVGISSKLLHLFVRAFSKENDGFFEWRFCPSSVFAYFFAIIYLLNIFLKGTDVFSIAVGNLYFIFNYVFAYIGFIALKEILTEKWHKTFLAVILLVGAIVMFSSIAVRLLGLFGAITVIITSRRAASDDDGRNNDFD